MKKWSFLLVVALVMSLAACGKTEKTEEKTELTVYAAASLTETLTEAAEQYMQEHDGVTITCNFDSSGTLKTQIMEGADCDLFLSAAEKQMDELETEGYLLNDTRCDLLENKVVLAVSEEGMVSGFDELAERLRDGSILLAMGNEDVPVGQYTKKILDYYELNEDDLAESGCVTYGSNVKEVTTQIIEGSVDCGIIYATDAHSAELTVVGEATEEMCGRAVYPAAVLNGSEKQDASIGFLNFLRSESSKNIFEKVGFHHLS